MATLFSKFLTKTDVSDSLSIHTISNGLIPYEDGQSLAMHAYDDSGQLWIFRCLIEQNGKSGAHVLCVDWLEFVRQRNVKVDDKVTFAQEILKDQSEEARMRIEVKRKIRLFGQDIWADVK